LLRPWSEVAGAASPNAEANAVEESMATQAQNPLTPAEQNLADLFERHIHTEFVDHDPDAAIATMTASPHLVVVPVLTGGNGRAGVRSFYATEFIPCIPPDTEMHEISRTIGRERMVIEQIFKFTHTLEMPWMLPGLAPTGRRVEIPMVLIIHVKDGKIDSEHFFWDQASVLVQLGLIDASRLPTAGIEASRRLLDPSLPANLLTKRAS
jgi:carboxymethylenebutenolidase